MIFREADVFAAIPQNPWLVSAPWLSLETMGLGEYRLCNLVAGGPRPTKTSLQGTNFQRDERIVSVKCGSEHLQPFLHVSGASAGGLAVSAASVEHLSVCT